MRTVSVRVEDLKKIVIPIGFVGENLHTKVIIDSTKVFADYPDAIAAMTVQPAAGAAYPAVVVRNGNAVEWDVSDSDLVNVGRGEIQLSFTVDEVIAKSYIGTVRVERSILPAGEVPEPIDDWMNRAETALSEIDGLTASAETLAAGSSATAEIAIVEGHKIIALGIPKGDKGDKGNTGATGQAGADGFSPTVGVSSITGGHRLTITDANGTQTVDVMDGDKGDTGNGIASVALNDDYTLTINYTNGQSYTTTSIRGAKGDKGNTGATGATPAFSIGTVTTGAAGSSAAATITGTAAAPVLNLTIPRGNPGDATIDDTAGAGDTTKVWSADKSSQLKSAVALCVDTETEWVTQDIDIKHDGCYYTNGEFHSDDKRTYAIVSANPGEKFKVSTKIRSTLIPAVLFFDGETFRRYEKAGNGTNEYLEDYEFTVPNDADTVIVQAVDNTDTITLKKYFAETSFRAYTKSETDIIINALQVSKRYGVKWDVDDPDDLGQRCFDAIGLSATIGVGSTNGSSDFDSIYPWSEMKRCNIKQNANGAKIVTFEGETGFALDGTNGDVFVRIPKFYYERYMDDGYEYRVVSATGSNVHPAFVEDGKELDEIFVGAFEGYINNNALASMADVIPTSNEIGQTFLTAAQSKGDGYSLYDMRCVDAVWTLMAVEYGCRNTNQILGYGYADFLQATNDQYGVVCDTAATATNVFSASISYTAARIGQMPVGSSIVICKGDQQTCIKFAKLTAVTSDSNHWYLTFDGDPVDLDTTCFIGSAGCVTNFCATAPSGALSWHTGRANWQSGSNTKNPVRYRWIENIIGSLWHLLPDITFYNLQMYQCRNIKDYVMHKHESPYLPVGSTYEENKDNGQKSDVTGYNYWITKLDHDIFSKGVDFGRAYDKSITSTKAFGAYYYLWDGTVCIANGGGFDHLYRCNMLTNRAWVSETSKWYLYGARLIYKNVG